jgi:uncharacterized membrane protein
LKTWNVAAFALNVALYVVTGYLFSSVVPIKFEGVRFWPQVIIPGVFAAVFGPWVGGLGAALGIFLNDIILGNNPLLSLMAGVTSNFAGFWLIGYIVNKRTQWKVSVVASGVVSALLIGLALVYVEPLYLSIIFSIAIAASYVVLVVVALLSSRWRSYEVGSVIGLLVGSAIIGVTVPLYGQYFAPEVTAITVPLILSTFVFTFSTEIPFLLILGPPILEAVYRTFPNLKPKKNQGNTSEENG